MLAVAVVLAVGALIALRVQFRSKADSWEEVLIWAALGLGFVGVGLSLVLSVLVRSVITRSETLVRTLGVAKKTAPAVIALSSECLRLHSFTMSACGSPAQSLPCTAPV